MRMDARHRNCCVPRGVSRGPTSPYAAVGLARKASITRWKASKVRVAVTRSVIAPTIVALDSSTEPTVSEAAATVGVAPRATRSVPPSCAREAVGAVEADEPEPHRREVPAGAPARLVSPSAVSELARAGATAGRARLVGPRLVAARRPHAALGSTVSETARVKFSPRGVETTEVNALGEGRVEHAPGGPHRAGARVDRGRRHRHEGGAARRRAAAGPRGISWKTGRTCW